MTIIKTQLIKITFYSLFISSLLFSCTSQPQETDSEKVETVEEVKPNSLTQAEKDAGWALLFDGLTSEGWRGYKKDTFPSGWQVIDGTIQCNASGKAGGALEGGDILFDKEFQNFTLSLEWKISKGGNSGIFYLGQEELDYIWKTAPEMQVLDNENFDADGKGKKASDVHQAGSLYDLIAASPQNSNPFGEWNTIEITVNNGAVTHKQNGKTVVEYQLWTPEWEAMIVGSKFPELNPDWAKVDTKGFIGLQDHGDDVWYRNIKIKEL